MSTATLAKPQPRTATGGIEVRAMRADDAGGLRALYESSSNASRWARFMAPVTRIPPSTMDALSTLGPDRVVVVAIVEGDLVGEARAHLVEPGTAELAILVRDDWQRRGVARALLDCLADQVRAIGVVELSGWIMPSNLAARGLLRALSPEASWRMEDGAVAFRILLTGSARPRAS